MSPNRNFSNYRNGNRKRKKLLKMGGAKQEPRKQGALVKEKRGKTGEIPKQKKGLRRGYLCKDTNCQPIAGSVSAKGGYVIGNLISQPTAFRQQFRKSVTQLPKITSQMTTDILQTINP